MSLDRSALDWFGRLDSKCIDYSALALFVPLDMGRPLRFPLWVLVRNQRDDIVGRCDRVASSL